MQHPTIPHIQVTVDYSQEELDHPEPEPHHVAPISTPRTHTVGDLFQHGGMVGDHTHTLTAD